MKFGDFSLNLSEINTLIFFSKFNSICSASTFSKPGVIFLYAFCWNNEYVLDNTGPEGLEKTYIDFSINTFPIDIGIISLFYYTWGI